MNGMHQEALNTYTMIVKNKAYGHSGRLRVNMGNIYFEEQKCVELLFYMFLLLHILVRNNQVLDGDQDVPHGSGPDP